MNVLMGVITPQNAARAKYFGERRTNHKAVFRSSSTSNKFHWAAADNAVLDLIQPPSRPGHGSIVPALQNVFDEQSAGFAA
jgi:hypothetical protein